ncbi:hypothetical protein CR513_30955, partial [Mucuna pruriens]
MELTSLVRQLAVSQHQPAMAAKLCGICTFVENSTDLCPTLQEIESDQPENVGAIGGFQYGRQQYQTQPFGNQRLDEAARNEQPRVPTVHELQQHAIPAKHDRHHSRPQNANQTASQHCEPTIVDRLEQPSLSNYSKPEGKFQCSNAQKR